MQVALPILVIAVVLGVVLPLTLGGSTKANVVANSTPTPSASASATPAPAAPTKCATIKPDPPAKGEPTVPQVTGKAPTTLVKKDVTVGAGTAAKSGDTVTVKYIGIACSTGKVFDASYTDGAKNKEFSFKLGAGSVIPGWDQGLVGMKAGGVRELVIPASLAYGATGSGSTIKGNETLIFLVTMDKV